jgi:hypothetical protein
VPSDKHEAADIIRRELFGKGAFRTTDTWAFVGEYTGDSLDDALTHLVALGELYVTSLESGHPHRVTYEVTPLGKLRASRLIYEAAKRARQDTCQRYAEHVTGWKPGDRLRLRPEKVGRSRRPPRLEVVSCRGLMPNSWELRPCVVCRVVRKDGTAGERQHTIRVGPHSDWRKWWEKEDAA